MPIQPLAIFLRPSWITPATGVTRRFVEKGGTYVNTWQVSRYGDYGGCKWLALRKQSTHAQAYSALQSPPHETGLPANQTTGAASPMVYQATRLAVCCGG